MNTWQRKQKRISVDGNWHRMHDMDCCATAWFGNRRFVSASRIQQNSPSLPARYRTWQCPEKVRQRFVMKSGIMSICIIYVYDVDSYSRIQMPAAAHGAPAGGDARHDGVLSLVPHAYKPITGIKNENTDRQCIVSSYPNPGFIHYAARPPLMPALADINPSAASGSIQQKENRGTQPIFRARMLVTHLRLSCRHCRRPQQVPVKRRQEW